VAGTSNHPICVFGTTNHPNFVFGTTNHPNFVFVMLVLLYGVELVGWGKLVTEIVGMSC